jgi:hypothetical protein
LALAIAAAAPACEHRPAPPAPPAPPAAADRGPSAAPAPPPARRGPYDALSRSELNRWAVRANVPLYWRADANGNGALDAGEVASLLFYPTSGTPAAEWERAGALTPALELAYRSIVAAAQAPSPAGPDARRQELVGQDLDQGRPTIVESDLRAVAPADRELVARMLEVARRVDELYDLQRGSTALEPQLPPDAASRSLFRRNRGPQCVAPRTEREAACSAIPGAPRPVFDLYPAALQADPGFCAALERRPDGKALLEPPFAVVRERGGAAGALEAVPYPAAYRAQMSGIAAALRSAAAAVTDPDEAALVAYLRAAATAFETNEWAPADEAWAAMGGGRSRWYVRVAPDEVYWEPCARKAGVHVTLARMNEASRAWQAKLSPLRQQMEREVARRAGRPYVAREVAFQLPDFIDIVINAGDARAPLGATIGQSLPNWGPVANEGRGRTVAMTNLYQDPDSRAARRSQAESVLDAGSLRAYTGDGDPGLLGTILHEAMHNLGPAHEYRVGGKTAAAVFGGPVASVMEELKAQTGALFLIELLRGAGIITAELALQSYADAVVWALGHVSQGMYTGSGERKTYGQLAAIQLGYLLERGAISWRADALAANGTDRGALAIDYERLVPAADDLMKVVAGIKARGDRAAALALIAKYVDGAVVPHAAIQERFLRVPKASFVYAVRLRDP